MGFIGKCKISIIIQVLLVLSFAAIVIGGIFSITEMWASGIPIYIVCSIFSIFVSLTLTNKSGNSAEKIFDNIGKWGFFSFLVIPSLLELFYLIKLLMQMGDKIVASSITRDSRLEKEKDPIKRKEIELEIRIRELESIQYYIDIKTQENEERSKGG